MEGRKAAEPNERSREVPIVLWASLPFLPHCFSTLHLWGGATQAQGLPKLGSPLGGVGNHLGFLRDVVLRLGASPLGRRML